MIATGHYTFMLVREEPSGFGKFKQAVGQDCLNPDFDSDQSVLHPIGCDRGASEIAQWPEIPGQQESSDCLDGFRNKNASFLCCEWEIVIADREEGGKFLSRLPKMDLNRATPQ
jgi:hypothetical protein